MTTIRLTLPGSSPAPLAKSLEPGRSLWAEVPPAMGALLCELQDDELLKGAGHKYIRKVPNGKGGWRYFYNVAGGKGIGHEDEMQHGAAFRLHHGGEAGHFHVTGSEGTKVRIKHDESGHEQWVEKRALTAMLHREHAEKISAHVDRTKKYVDAAHTHGSESQRARAKAHAARYGHTRHLADAPKGEAKAADGAAAGKGTADAKPGAPKGKSAAEPAPKLSAAEAKRAEMVAKLEARIKAIDARKAELDAKEAQLGRGKRPAPTLGVVVGGKAGPAGKIGPDPTPKSAAASEDPHAAMIAAREKFAAAVDANKGMPPGLKVGDTVRLTDKAKGIKGLDPKWGGDLEVVSPYIAGTAQAGSVTVRAPDGDEMALAPHQWQNDGSAGEGKGLNTAPQSKAPEAPKRATPDQVTGDELAQRREAARKSAEARRKAPEPEAAPRTKKAEDSKRGRVKAPTTASMLRVADVETAEDLRKVNPKLAAQIEAHPHLKVLLSDGVPVGQALAMAAIAMDEGLSRAIPAARSKYDRFNFLGTEHPDHRKLARALVTAGLFRKDGARSVTRAHMSSETVRASAWAAAAMLAMSGRRPKDAPSTPWGRALDFTDYMPQGPDFQEAWAAVGGDAAGAARDAAQRVKASDEADRKQAAKDVKEAADDARHLAGQHKALAAVAGKAGLSKVDDDTYKVDVKGGIETSPAHVSYGRSYPAVHAATIEVERDPHDRGARIVVRDAHEDSVTDKLVEFSEVADEVAKFKAKYFPPTGSDDPKRAAPGQLTEDELEQRRENARRQRKAPEPEKTSKGPHAADLASARGGLKEALDTPAARQLYEGGFRYQALKAGQTIRTESGEEQKVARRNVGKVGVFGPDGHLVGVSSAADLANDGVVAAVQQKHKSQQKLRRESEANEATFQRYVDMSDDDFKAAVTAATRTLLGAKSKTQQDKARANAAAVRRAAGAREQARKAPKAGNQAKAAGAAPAGATKGESALHGIAKQVEAEHGPEVLPQLDGMLDHFKEHGSFPDDATIMDPARGATLADVHAFQVQRQLDGIAAGPGGKGQVDLVLRRGGAENFPSLADAPEGVLRELLKRNDGVGMAAETVALRTAWGRKVPQTDLPSYRQSQGAPPVGEERSPEDTQRFGLGPTGEAGRRHADEVRAAGVAERAAKEAAEAKERAAAERQAKAAHHAAEARQRRDAAGAKAATHAHMMRYASRDKTRPNLLGVHYKDGMASATDGHRVASAPAKYPAEWEGTTRGKGGVEVKGGFPDIAQIQVDHQGGAQIDAKQTHAAAKELSKVGEGIVTLSREAGRLVMHSRGDRSNRVDLGPTSGSGEGKPVHVNAKYLGDALHGASGAVRIGLGESLQPISIERGDGQRHTVMPLRS